MDVFECVSSLRSVRKFLETEVPKDTIKRILQAGRLSPSAHNDQPWKFILVNKKESIRQLAKYCISGSFTSGASFAIVILTDSESKWYQIDGTRAAQNMILTAWSEGVGTCWIGRIDSQGLKDYMNIPERWHVLTVLPFGYIDERQIPSGKSRKNEGDVFYLEKFGAKL